MHAGWTGKLGTYTTTGIPGVVRSRRLSLLSALRSPVCQMTNSEMSSLAGHIAGRWCLLPESCKRIQRVRYLMDCTTAVCRTSCSSGTCPVRIWHDRAVATQSHPLIQPTWCPSSKVGVHAQGRGGRLERIIKFRSFEAYDLTQSTTKHNDALIQFSSAKMCFHRPRRNDGRTGAT